MDPSTVLALSFDSLEIDSSNSTENIDHGNCSPNAMAVGDHENLGFLSLPREVRDQIYLDLVVAEDPIQFDKDFESLSRSDTFADTAMRWMFDVVSNTQIARETRETFYQHNTFLIYTHDIPLLYTKTHAMLFRAGKGLEAKTTYSTPFDVGAWVRKLAVRVGWHASGGWFTDPCCQYPARELRLLLEQASLRSVIIDARFGAWPYGAPQGIEWSLLEEMNTKWGKEFRIYNGQTLGSDTRRYPSDRRELSDILLPRNRSSQNSEGPETASANGELEEAIEDYQAPLSSFGTEDEEREESRGEEGEYWEEEDYWEGQEEDVYEREAWSGDELAQGSWSTGEKLIIQAGERLIQSAKDWGVLGGGVSESYET